MKKISSNNISIIAQGVVGKETNECIVSLRKVFPSAQIILVSTNVEDLEVNELIDEIVIPEDVGGGDCE